MTKNTYMTTRDEIRDYLESVFDADRRSREHNDMEIRCAEILGGYGDD